MARPRGREKDGERGDRGPRVACGSAKGSLLGLGWQMDSVDDVLQLLRRGNQLRRDRFLDVRGGANAPLSTAAGRARLPERVRASSPLRPAAAHGAGPDCRGVCGARVCLSTADYRGVCVCVTGACASPLESLATEVAGALPCALILVIRNKGPRK